MNFPTTVSPVQGNFLWVALCERPAKSPKGLCREPNRCDVIRDQMAKVSFTEFSEVALRVALTVSALAPFWASLHTVAEPKPPAPPVMIAEALVRSIRAPNRMSYAAVGGPNQLLSASGSTRSVPFPTQAIYPSGRINTAVGALTAPNTGSSHLPTYSALISRTRCAHGVMSKPPASPR